MLFKRIISALVSAALVLSPMQALAQAGVQLPAGTVYGNDTAAQRPGKAATMTAMFDRAFGSTRGSILSRTASTWGLVTPGTAGLPFVSNGAGDPAYQVLGIAGGGTGQTTRSPAITALMPTANSGDVPAWNGTSWVAGQLFTSAINSKINLVKRQVFTANGTYTPTTGMVYADIGACGPGGGGGGTTGSVGQVFSGGGGGSGGISQKVVTAADVGASKTVTIGTGGAGGSTGSNNGADGSGASSIGSLVVANAGGGGKFGSAIGFPNGGAAGAAGTGDFTAAAGKPGSPGIYNTNNTVIFPGGNGGSSPFGGGGRGGYASGASANGEAAVGYCSGGAGAVSHNIGTTGAGGAGSNGIAWAVEYVAQNLIPSAAAPVTIQRTDSITYLVHTPIINGAPGEYVEWTFKNVGIGMGVGDLFSMTAVSTNENGTVRVQSDPALTGSSVFEYVMNIGRTDNAFGTYQLAGGLHGNTTGGSTSVTMDGGSNLVSMQIGNYVAGTQLVVAQTPTLKLPATAAPNGTPGSNFTAINQGHIITATGVVHSWTSTPSQPNAGDQNSYMAMLPLSGMNRAQFGAAAAFAINTGVSVQTNQGQVDTIQTWHTDRPDLRLVLNLPSTVPVTPGGWTLDTTTSTFNQDNVAPNFNKIYINYRSGAAGIAATNDNHVSRYYVTK
jgi:hypothetical protein